MYEMHAAKHQSVDANARAAVKHSPAVARINRRSIALASIGAALCMSFGAGQAFAQQKPLIAAIFPNQSNQAWVTIAEGMRAEAARLGYEFLLTDARDNIAKQLSDSEDALTRNPKVVLLIGVDSGAAQITKNANARKIPVINVQRNIPGDVVSFVGSDNEVSGEAMMQWWANQLKGRTAETLVITGTPGSASSMEREKGIDTVLARHPNIKVVAKQSGFYDRAKTLPVAENMLEAHPKAEAIIGLNDEIAMGALAAAKARGRKLVITGGDGNQDALKAVKAGDVAMSLVFDLREIGRLSVETADSHLKSKPVQKKYIMPVTYVTKENVDKYLK